MCLLYTYNVNGCKTILGPLDSTYTLYIIIGDVTGSTVLGIGKLCVCECVRGCVCVCVSVRECV